MIECLLSRGGTIQGVVIDEKGKPIMGLPVVVNSILCRRDVKTDPNGHFIASHLPDTRYSVSVEPDSESPYATTVLTGGASCDAEGLRIVVKQKTEVKAPAFGVGEKSGNWGELPCRLNSRSARARRFFCAV